MLTFPPGSSNGAMECLDIVINDDNILENFESFIVNLTTSETYVTLKSNANEILATIRDNDGESACNLVDTQNINNDNHYPVVTVSLPAMLRVVEGDGTVSVCVTLFESTEVAVTVTLTTMENTGKQFLFPLSLYCFKNITHSTGWF